MRLSPRARPGLAPAAAVAVLVAPGALAASGPVSIVIGLGRSISPAQAQAPASFVDDDGRLLVLDQARGFVLGRFRLPPGMGELSDPALGGVLLEGGTVMGPALPVTPLTRLRGMPGFPCLAEGPVGGSPCAADLNRDGRSEIVAATTDGVIQVVGADGRALPGWPRRTEEAFYTAPACGDLEGDRRGEIVIGAQSGRLYAWQEDGSPVPGWPRVLIAPGEDEASALGTPAVEDLDGDGRDEICVATEGGRVWLIGGNGMTRPGWPKALPACADPPNAASVLCAPALADLDGDGDLEVIVPTNAGRVHAWHVDGAPVSGWSVEVPYRARAGFGGVAVADIDGRDGPEVVVAGEQGLLGPASVAAFSARGTLLPGWPYHLPETVNAGPALGDLSGDGVADVVVATIGGDPTVHALDGRQARPLPGWPAQLREQTVNASPILADVDGDGRVDVLVAALATGAENQSWLWAFDSAGRVLDGFPVVLPRDEIVRAAPVVGDFEGDGDLELLLATEAQNNLHGWKLDVLCEPSLLPWPAEAGGASRTGRLNPGVAATAVTPAAAPGAGGETPLTTIAFELRQDTHVRLRIFDIQSRPVRRLLDSQLPPGSYRIHWDGRGDGGQNCASGVYSYQLTLGGRATTRQLLLLK